MCLAWLAMRSLLGTVEDNPRQTSMSRLEERTINQWYLAVAFCKLSASCSDAELGKSVKLSQNRLVYLREHEGSNKFRHACFMFRHA